MLYGACPTFDITLFTFDDSFFVPVTLMILIWKFVRCSASVHCPYPMVVAVIITDSATAPPVGHAPFAVRVYGRRVLPDYVVNVP